MYKFFLGLLTIHYSFAVADKKIAGPKSLPARSADYFPDAKFQEVSSQSISIQQDVIQWAFQGK